MAIHTESDFDALCWHDCSIWGIELRVGDIDAGDWTTELVLKLDFILEWISSAEHGAQWRIAPATLVFHGVTDFCIHVNKWGDTYQNGLQVLEVDRIHRERIVDQRVYLDRPYYSWTIALNAPTVGVIAFGAYGFTQTKHGDGVLKTSQSLSLMERRVLSQP